MRIEQLRYIVTVANYHSITLASEQLHISRQNISKAIKQLEDELQIKIFRRSNQGVFLTLDGQKLFYCALEVLNKVETIEEIFIKTSLPRESLSGELILKFHDTICAMLYDQIQQFIEQYPFVQTKLYMHSNNGYLDDNAHLNDSIYGLSILYDNFPILSAAYPEYDFYILKKEPLKVILSKNHVLASQRSISLKALSQYPLILFGNENETDSFMKQAFLQHHLKPNIYAQTNSYETALEFVSRNAAYCFGSNYIFTSKVNFMDENICTVPLSEYLVLAHMIMLPKKSRSSQINNAFLSIVQNTISEF